MEVLTQNSSIGFVEPFFYSKDRNALLQTLVDGTEEKVYYSLIQLDNEIEHALRINDKKTIDDLLSKYDDFVQNIENTSHTHLSNSLRINNLITRNNLRFIDYDDHRSLKAWKQIEDELKSSTDFSHKKPKTNRLVQASDDIQYDSHINSFEIVEKMSQFFSHCIEHKSVSFTTFFSASSIHHLVSSQNKMKQLHPSQIGTILNWDTAIYLDEHVLFQLIKMDFERNKSSFGSRSIHRHLTLDQLNALYDESDTNGLLSSNKAFLEAILIKSIPKPLMRYPSFSDLNSESPQLYKQQYYQVIQNFIAKHLTLPTHHQAHKCVLLHYLLTEQYSVNGTVDINLFIEYLRIPKRRQYNTTIWKYYDQYNTRYDKQQHALSYQKTRKWPTLKWSPFKTGQNEGQDDADEDQILKQIHYIGSEFECISPIYKQSSFGPITTDDDMKLIQDALQYFFNHPDAISNALSDKLTKSIKGDATVFNRLKSEYKEGDTEDEEKELEFVDCESYLVLQHFVAYVSRDILLSAQCEFELSTGNDTTYAQSYTNLAQLKSSLYVEELKNKVIIEYDPFQNKQDYLVDDDIILNVKLKNVKSLLLKVFKMQTTAYYKQNKSEVASDINLEGLSSKTLDEQISIELKNEFQVQHLEIPLKSIKGARGLYFVDIIGNGQHSRALIRNGDLKYVQKRTGKGHILKLLDENHNVLRDGTLWIDTEDKTYHADPNDDHNICVPYSSVKNDKSRKVVSAAACMEAYSVLGELEIKNTKYQLHTCFYVDRESLLEKNECLLMIKSQLFVNNTTVSLTLLESVELDINITSMDGNSTDKKFKNIHLSDDHDVVVKFVIPVNTEALGLRLNCKCKNIDGSFEEFWKRKQFKINGINRTKGIATAHLIPYKTDDCNSFIVSVLGKNGEALKDVLCNLRFEHYQLASAFDISAQSDGHGRIVLPYDMNGIQSLSITCAGHTETFAFPYSRCLSPKVINIDANQAFVIPYFSINNLSNDKDITFKLYDTEYAKDYTDTIQYNSGCFECKAGLGAGIYVLHADYHSYECTINVIRPDKVIKMPNADYAIEDAFETFRSLSNHTPLQIGNIIEDLKNNKIRIKINGGNTSHVRVHIVFNHTYPSFPIFNSLKDIPYATPETYVFNRAPTLYTKQRTISEEYKYVLDRVSAHKYVGNMFPTPSLLLRPWSSRTTKTEAKDAAKGDKIEHKSYKKRMRCSEESELKFHEAQNMDESGSYSSLEFLCQSPSKLLTNLKCDADGYVIVDKSLNPNHTFLTVIASDDQSWTIRSDALQQYVDCIETEEKTEDNDMDLPSFKYSDVRLFPGLDISKHFVQQREIELLYSKEQSCKIANYKNSQYEIFPTLESIYNLYLLLSKNTTLEEFSFLLHWDDLTEIEKQRKVNKYLSHEMNLYLYCKHRQFFDDKIKPFIQNKLQKTFMDYWLLSDLDALFTFSSFGRFHQLNAAEQILLAVKFKNDSTTHCITNQILNYFKEKNKSQRISPLQLQTLFKTVLSNNDEHKEDPTHDHEPKPSKPLQVLGKADPSLMIITANPFESYNLRTSTQIRAIENAPKRCYSISHALSPRYSEAQDFNELSSVCCARSVRTVCAVQRRGRMSVELSMSSVECDATEPSVMDFRMNSNISNEMVVSEEDEKTASIQRDARLFMNLVGFGEDNMATLHVHGMDVDDDEDDDENDMVGLGQKAVDKTYFKQLENTREYQECNYFHIAWNQSTANLVGINKFWCDYAEHLLDADNQQQTSFLSKYFWLSIGSFTEMMIALAVLDLPAFSKDKDENNMIVKEMNDSDEMMLYCDSPCIIFSKQLKETVIATSSTIHSDVHYFDAYNKKDSKQYLDPITDTFEPTKIYGVRVIITNSSSDTRDVELLYQIPTGSIAVENKGLTTVTEFISINSYSGTNIEFYFYFPSPGTYKQFAIQISDEKGNVLSHCKTPSITVAYAKPLEDSNIDLESWDQVSVSGKNEDVIHYLQKHSLYDTDLSSIYWRLNDHAFFKIITDYLRSIRCYDSTIWKYSLKHRQLSEVKEMIERESLFQPCFKPSFYSKWLQFDEVESNGDWFRFAYLEYYPLINARTHPLGQERTINNEQFKNQYESFLNYAKFQGVSLHSAPVNVLLQSVYYLLLQNRINECTEIFALMDESEASEEYGVHYDYLHAYLSIYDDGDVQCAVARDIVDKYKNINHLTAFKQRFLDDIESQLTEFDEDTKEKDDVDEDTKYDESDANTADNKDKLQKLLSPSIDFDINENGKIEIKYNKMNAIEIKFYKMEIELLFSMSPFLSVESNDIFSYIEANESMIVTLPDNQHEFVVSFPKSLQHQNIYISVAPIKQMHNDLNLFQSKAFYDNQLIVELKDRFGLLRVLDRKHLRNIPKAYIKVYAFVNGSAKFHKDGYTDRRGQFDYVSVSCTHLMSTTKFAILIKTQKYGSMVKTVFIPRFKDNALVQTQT
eukprot:17194_1